MKTLRAFWHWVDNEKPSLEDYAERGLKNVSPLALESLMQAERIVNAHTGHAGQKLTDEEVMRFRPAIRDLSLSLCTALGIMHEQVEKDCLKPKPRDEMTPWTQPSWTRQLFDQNRTMNEQLFKREYLADWVPATFESAPRATDAQLRGVRIDREAVERVVQRDSPSGWTTMQQLANMAPGRVLGRAVLSGDITVLGGGGIISNTTNGR